MPAQKELSQDEIWDDTALLQSWDEALNEYKWYHSIHVRGETIDESPEGVEAHDADDFDGPKECVTQGGHRDMEHRKIEAIDGLASSQHGADRNAQIDMAARNDRVPTLGPASDGAVASNLPQNLVGEVRDESLKNLMMSWYWAGYYTGLNEGLKQTKRKTGQPAEKGETIG